MAFQRINATTEVTFPTHADMTAVWPSYDEHARSLIGRVRCGEPLTRDQRRLLPRDLREKLVRDGDAVAWLERLHKL